MTDREAYAELRKTADALAREMVAKGWEGWKAGMLVTNDAHSWDPMGDPSRLISRKYAEPGDRPCLLDDATAALIAVEVVKDGPFVLSDDTGFGFEFTDELLHVQCHNPKLGIAAAEAWLYGKRK